MLNRKKGEGRVEGSAAIKDSTRITLSFFFLSFLLFWVFFFVRRPGRARRPCFDTNRHYIFNFSRNRNLACECLCLVTCDDREGFRSLMLYTHCHVIFAPLSLPDDLEMTLCYWQGVQIQERTSLYATSQDMKRVGRGGVKSDVIRVIWQ